MESRAISTYYRLEIGELGRGFTRTPAWTGEADGFNLFAPL